MQCDVHNSQVLQHFPIRLVNIMSPSVIADPRYLFSTSVYLTLHVQAVRRWHIDVGK